MSKSNIFVLAILLLATISYLTYFFMNSSKNQLNNDDNGGTPKVVNQDDYKLTYTYKGNNNWDYVVVGNMPTPCYEVVVEGLVRESYPEQVVIGVKLVAPGNDVMCAQVITPFEKSGVVNASEGATFQLNIEK